MVNTIKNFKTLSLTDNQNVNNRNEDTIKIWVSKWVDYSSKYGMGYLLNNGNYGVYFNDCTKILEEGNSGFIYIERNNNKLEVIEKYEKSNYP
jgi:polo-like kinase 1